MDKIASYKIIPSLNLILEYLSGNLNWSDIKELKKKEYADPDYNNNYYLIGDVRDSIVTFENDSELTEFVKYVKDEKVALSDKLVGILTDTPNNVVNSTLIIMYSEKLPMVFKIFSTVESLTNWFGKDEYPTDEVAEHLNEHRNNPVNIFDLKKH